MARKKKREIEEEISVTEEGKMVIPSRSKTRKRTKIDVNESQIELATLSSSRRESKRRKVNENKKIQQNIESNDTIQSVAKKVKIEKNSKSVTKKNLKEVNNKILSVNGMSDKESKQKIESKSKKLTKSKKSMPDENEFKIKNAQVLLKKLVIKQENNHSVNESSSSNPTDSGVSSDQMVKVEKILSKNKYLIKTETPSCSNSSNIGNDASSSESEWEDVEENKEQALEDYNPVIPEEGVEITIDCPDLKIRRRKKKEFDEMDYIRLYVNRMRKEAQMNVHKTHLLCLLAHGFYVNDLLNSTILKGIALSVLPTEILALTSGKKIDKIDIDGIEKIVKWFRSSFSYNTERDSFVNISNNLVKCFETKKAFNTSEYNLMFIIFVRSLGFKTRLCVSLYPVSHKAQNLIKKCNNKKSEKKTESATCEVNEPKSNSSEQKSNKEKTQELKPKKEKTHEQKPKKEKTHKQEPKPKKKTTKEKQKSTAFDEKESKKFRPRRSTGKSYKENSGESADDPEDEDFKVEEEDVDFEKPKIYRKNSTKTPRKSNRKILSSDSECSSPQSSAYAPDKVVCWAEIYSKKDKQWISIECINNILNKPYDIESYVPQPVIYILGIDNSSYVKDLTRRYCKDYMTSTIKLRADSEWWDETLTPFLPPNSKLDKDEEKSLDNMLINQPLPTTVSGFKNHPLYALKRHLLKFEAIYPPDAVTVGFIRGEPVYPRECVCQLHSRETWLKEARTVRIGEEPYKIVKARPKWDKIAGVFRTDLPLEIFGFWQTQPYEPPTAVDGKVPRNEYGNVELFKPCMLPKGTVHLQLPGLNRIAKKLGIDCSSAVIGFDISKFSIHPVYDGFVICEEFKDTIIAAWEEEQENIRKRDEEKREKRIYGNWKKLIKGLLIRERIKLKYEAP
ncbi:DNA repair protein complementing XP-C cells homolog [Caerostris extrusa]|uniref:DNA repair protein complementing XP-C cells homolog n=1 Tax=Caerostris extrusa TaxID=172846 RepID=A0AAV4P3R0_CAEEX|nr:DNA repair protein complementing XP-C cells homolog [Caerostris extrusa]